MFVTRERLVSALLFFNCSLFLCRHLETNFDLLINSVSVSALIICSFYLKHRSHLLEILLYGLALEIIDHCIVYSLLSSLRFHICLESSVLLAYFLLEKDSLCCVNRCLKVPSVNPM